MNNFISKYSRRSWIKSTAKVSAGMYLGSSLISCIQQNTPNPKVIMVVSGWQDVNIGDIAHTPGLLSVLQTFLPDSKIILWKKSHSTQVMELLESNFPEVDIIYGQVDSQGNVGNEEVLAAMDEADILIHGSGPYIVGASNLKAWIKHTNKPFGIFGDTIQTISDDIFSVLQKASFIFTRETKSLEVLSGRGIKGESVIFGPDATFYCDLKNEEKAMQFLDKNGLEEKKFVCVIPRLRYTPYYKIKANNAGMSEEEIAKVEAHNSKYKEKDHAKMREVMIAWVRETGNKVLVCPEMTYQVDIMDELLIDPLPNDIKPFVVKHGYWLPDEAASIYARAHSVYSFECHSPILALRKGTPMFYLRQPEDTIKGQMYYDLNLSDWVFEIDNTEASEIVKMSRQVWDNYPDAQHKVSEAMGIVDGIYNQCTTIIKRLMK
ncbi:MAG: polysaccharide pyruvyl transferase family protein [Cyclobacteriaceae bacterium]